MQARQLIQVSIKGMAKVLGSYLWGVLFQGIFGEQQDTGNKGAGHRGSLETGSNQCSNQCKEFHINVSIFSLNN